jgi:hypothetical protein
MGASCENVRKPDTIVRLESSPPPEQPVHLIPIYLEKTQQNRPRNWEGLVRFEDRGFLVVTDKFSITLLAFVPLPPG